MKREGRQHGMVRTYPIISAPWGPRGPKPNGPSPVPAAGPFAKVPTKPTAHSKFTGKCGRPMCRECHLGPPSKSRYKVKGAHRLRSDVVSDGLKMKLWGSSASTALDYLDRHIGDCMDDEEFDVEEVVECGEVKENVFDEEMSFCEVGFAWEDGDEDWCLV